MAHRRHCLERDTVGAVHASQLMQTGATKADHGEQPAARQQPDGAMDEFDIGGRYGCNG